MRGQCRSAQRGRGLQGHVAAGGGSAEGYVGAGVAQTCAAGGGSVNVYGGGCIAFCVRDTAVAAHAASFVSVVPVSGTADTSDAEMAGVLIALPRTFLLSLPASHSLLGKQPRLSRIGPD